VGTNSAARPALYQPNLVKAMSHLLTLLDRFKTNVRQSLPHLPWSRPVPPSGEIRSMNLRVGLAYLDLIPGWSSPSRTAYAVVAYRTPQIIQQYSFYHFCCTPAGLAPALVCINHAGGVVDARRNKVCLNAQV
jgi:hypothetical protein